MNFFQNIGEMFEGKKKKKRLEDSEKETAAIIGLESEIKKETEEKKKQSAKENIKPQDFN